MDCEVPRDLSSTVDALTERLLTLDRVVGVFWGTAREGGELTDEPALVVHVREKRLEDAVRRSSRIPRRMQGIRIDVVDVGGPIVAHGWRDPVRSPSPTRWGRSCTVTATGGGLALLSGHGALPLRGGKVQRRLSASTAAVRWGAHRGSLVAGAIRADVDFAVGQFPNGLLPQQHPAASPARSPHRWQTLASLPLHTRVVVSTRERGSVTGTLDGAAGWTGLVYLRTGDSHQYLAVPVAPVDPAEPFSLPGDSGALVTDEDGVAVGTVVAGTRRGRRSYILPLRPLIIALKQDASQFFA
jgi:hypothetical protein